VAANPNYQPEFDIDYRRGMVGENLVGSFLEQLPGGTIEVKTDYHAWRTGNLYIETHQQLASGEWVKSGINLSQADFYCFAGPAATGFLTIRKPILVNLVRERSIPVRMDKKSATSRATMGYLVKVADVVALIFEGDKHERPGSFEGGTV